MIYGFSDIECNRQIFVILDCFLLFYPPNNPKNKNFEKLKKDPGDIIILHMCTKNHDQVLYCSLDMQPSKLATANCNCRDKTVLPQQKIAMANLKFIFKCYFSFQIH